MSIEQTSHSFCYGTGISLVHDHISSGINTALVVGISYVPTTEVSGVSYGGQELALIAGASQGDQTAQSVWYMVNPPTGTSSVSVDFYSETNALVNASTFSGIQQTGTMVFNSRTAVGLGVKELPIKSFSKAGSISIGVGTTNNQSSYVTQLSSAQTEDWNTQASGLNIHSQAISAQLPVTLNEITVGNVLTEAADWAIVIIGFEGA